MFAPESYVLRRRIITVTRTFQNPKANMLHSCNFLLIYYMKDFPVTGVQVDFSNGQGSYHWMDYSLVMGRMLCKLEAKDYQCIELLFAFISGNANKDTGCIKDSQVLTVNMTYFGFLSQLYSKTF